MSIRITLVPVFYYSLFYHTTIKSDSNAGAGDYRGSSIQTLALVDPCILSCSNSRAKVSRLFTTRGKYLCKSNEEDSRLFLQLED